MRPTAVLLIALAGATVALPAPTAFATPPMAQMPAPYLASSVKSELEAFSIVVTATETALTSNGGTMSEAAQTSHKRSQELFGEAKKLAEADNHADAYRKLRDAWRARKVVNEEFVSRASNKQLADVVTRYVGVMETRIADVAEHLASSDETARKHYEEGKSSYARAKETVEKGDYKTGFARLRDCMDHMEKALVKGAR